MDRIYLVRADFLSTTERSDSAAFYIHKAIKNSSTELNLINSQGSMAELKLYYFKMDSQIYTSIRL
ncbi:hypothetical protein [Chryseobacterium sp. c4a]|uniref:hypothetical protein n=1 Tax=Chryseobacterium sp. c4a TaxID=1573582 RepID=UPI0013588071|nr:hypothetical protein [Chryseobacterium sp. c4a]